MIKKALALLLILVLMPLAVLAEEAVYTPGELAKAPFAEAFARGDMIMCDLRYALALNEHTDIWREDASALALIADVLKNAQLSAGVGKLDNGLRIALGGQYAPVGTESVALDAVLDITDQGVSIMSSAIDGERVSAGWETILLLLGLEQEDVSAMLSLGSMDYDALFAEMAASLEPMLEVIGQVAMPYVQIISGHIMSLPMEVSENVPAEGNFPAAASELYVMITQKAVGDLFLALCDHLEQDTTLCAILDSALAEEELSVSTLCASVRESCAEMTDESVPLHLFLGLDETGAPLYLHLLEEYTDGRSDSFTLAVAPGEVEGSTLLTLNLLLTNASGEIDEGFTLAVESLADPVNRNVLDLGAAFTVYSDRIATFNLEFLTSNAASATTDGQPGYTGTHALDMQLIEENSIADLVLACNTQQSKTAGGGEQGSANGALEFSVDNQLFAMTFEISQLFTPGDGAPSYAMVSSLHMPEFGIGELTEDALFYTQDAEPFDSAAASAKPLALETATTDEINELLARAEVSLLETLTQLTGLLPATLSQELL